jgi:dCMP deaminase
MSISNNNRPSWDEYFLNIVSVVATRATCDRGKSGCVIVKENRILSTGYVGSPGGFPDCYEAGHILREVKYEDGTIKQHCVRTIHAEQNAIVYAARFGVSLEGATLYCTMQPCYVCAMIIVAAGIKRVVCSGAYQSNDSAEIFKKAGIDLLILNKEVIKY